jgi:uncharacterized protein YggE
MKRALLCLVALVLLIPFSKFTSSQAQGIDAPGTISVTGSADVRVVPDEVKLTLGIETNDMNLRVAKQQNDDRVKQVLALAEQFGIKPEYIQTDFIRVQPRYKDYYEQQTFLGYWVRKDIVFTLKDISRFDDLLTAVLDAGANYVFNVDFRTTELRKYRDQARSAAIKAAKEKAEALAGELGMAIGEARSIQENQQNWWSSYSWWGNNNGGSNVSQNVIQESGPSASSLGEDATFAPGQITVNASVSVTFTLVPKK